LETSYGSLLFPGDIDQYQPASFMPSAAPPATSGEWACERG
jgi:hypothetical protein